MNNLDKQKLKGTDDFFGATYRLALTGIVNGSELKYCRQIIPNGEWYAEWRSICDGDYSSRMSAGTTVDGRIGLVAVSDDTNHVHYIMQLYNEDVTGSDAIDWNDPIDLGIPDGVSSYAQVGLNRGYDDLDNVIVVSDDGEIFWKAQNPMTTVETTETITPPGTDEPIEVTVEKLAIPDEPWTDWMQIPSKVRSVVGVHNFDGTMLLCGIEPGTHKVFTSHQDSENPQSVSAWSDWVEVPDVQAKQMIPILSQHGLVNLAIVTTDGAVKVAIQDGQSVNSFTVQRTLSDSETPVTYLKPVLDGDRYMALVAMGTQYANQTPIYFAMEATPGAVGDPATWTDWQEISQIEGRCQISVRLQSDGRLVLFDRQQDENKVKCLTQTNIHSFNWGGGTGWVTIGENVSGFAHTVDFTPGES